MRKRRTIVTQWEWEELLVLRDLWRLSGGPGQIEWYRGQCSSCELRRADTQDTRILGLRVWLCLLSRVFGKEDRDPEWGVKWMDDECHTCLGTSCSNRGWSSFILLLFCNGNMTFTYYKWVWVAHGQRGWWTLQFPRYPLHAHMPVLMLCPWRQKAPAAGNASSEMEPHSGGGSGGGRCLC